MDNMTLTVRRSIELLGLVALIAVIYVGQGIIMPFLMAFFISLLLLPFFQFF